MLSFNKEIWGANLTLVSYISLHLYLGSCLHFNLHCNVMLCNLVSEYMFCFCNLVTVAFEIVENWKREPSWELMDLWVSFSKLRLSLVLMMLLFYWPLSRLVIFINFVFIQKDQIRSSLYFSDQQLLELLEANVVSLFVNSVRQAPVYGFFKLFGPGISCGKLVDRIIERKNEDRSSVNEFATYLSHQLWSIIKGKAVHNKDKEKCLINFITFRLMRIWCQSG